MRTVGLKPTPYIVGTCCHFFQAYEALLVRHTFPLPRPQIFKAGTCLGTRTEEVRWGTTVGLSPSILLLLSTIYATEREDIKQDSDMKSALEFGWLDFSSFVTWPVGWISIGWSHAGSLLGSESRFSPQLCLILVSGAVKYCCVGR